MRQKRASATMLPGCARCTRQRPCAIKGPIALRKVAAPMGSATFPAPQRRNDHRFGERQPLSHRLLIRRERLQHLPHAQQGRLQLRRIAHWTHRFPHQSTQLPPLVLRWIERGRRHRRSGRLNRKNPCSLSMRRSERKHAFDRTSCPNRHCRIDVDLVG